MNRLPDYLYGAVDLHIHSAPDVYPRRFDDIELAGHLHEGGFSGCILKSHIGSTVERAFLVRRVLPAFGMYGGLVLNDTVGGFNIEAGRAALQLGAREIWMPTKSAHNHKVHHHEHGGLSALDAHGDLRHDLREIVFLAAESNAALGTGHLSPAEGAALIRYAWQQGVKRILVTHPEWATTKYPVELQRELANYGAYFERCFFSTTPLGGSVSMADIAGAIAAVGHETTVLASDLGQPDTPEPVAGMIEFAEQLEAEGFSRDQLRRMMVDNPIRFLKADNS